jgi:adenylate cyclase, class 2
MAMEVERKYRVKSHADIRARVETLGGKWASPIAQSDRYFAHPARDFSQTDEALRIRSVGDHNVITYKGPKIDRESKTREEIEVAVGSGELCARDLGVVLERLGFRPVLTVLKKRSIAEIDWHGHSVEIALDEVAGAGDFVELETQSDESQLDNAKECTRSLAAQLGLADADQERRSYLELVLLGTTTTPASS